MNRKFGIAIFLVLALAALGTWQFTRPVSYIPGKVENQIHGFGLQLTPALAATSTFTKIANGYQPKPEPPQAPTGLKPQELQAWTSFAQRHSGEPALSPTFPERYSTGTRVRSQGMTVSLKPLGSNAASAQIENGKLVYHNIYPSTDSLNVVSDGRSEEFLLLHDASAPQRFDYDLSSVTGVKNITLSDNAIHFTNAQGQQLQIEAPWLIESGQPVAVAGSATVPPSVARSATATQVHWELSYPNGLSQPRLALVINNPEKLHYPVVIDPTWAVTNGSMISGRYLHTATLLTNGSVLVAGGYNTSSGFLASAELYNPSTGTWTATGSMIFGRYLHTATLLPNGQVLVAGGSGAFYGSSLSSTEIYNPATGTWTATGSMIFGRYLHTATLLQNGKVLVAGGVDSNGSSLSSAELYNPATGAWTVTGSLSNARNYHTATLLPNGGVLVAGGSGNSGYLTSAELFNPANGTWAATGSMSTARAVHTATLLPNGNVLVAGGEGSTGSSLSSAEIYNPAVGTFSNTGSLNTARAYYTATLLPNGQVLAATGYTTTNALKSTTSAEIYNPSNGTWTVTGSLSTGRCDHTATLLPNGNVLVAGGADINGHSVTSTELYNPASGTFSATGNLNTARYGHSSTLLPNGSVIVAGSIGSSSATSELYNSITGIWTATGALNAARGWHTANLLPNGQVLVAGGLGVGGAIASSELYNPGSGAWTYTGSLNVARFSGTGTLLRDGQVLVAGGDAYSAAPPVNSTELYNPITSTWTLARSMNVARSNHTATLLPNGQVLVVGGIGSTGPLASTELYNPTTATWVATGSLNVGRYSHTATLLPDGDVLVAGGSGATGNDLASAELYNSMTGTWTVISSLNTARSNHTATLMSNGQVLVAGGISSAGTALNSAELFDTETGVWTATNSLTTGRGIHTATLLVNGQVLLSGGYTSTNSAELFNPGLGYTSATQPLITTIVGGSSTSSFSLSGTNFTGVSEASGGGTNNSASNIPVVQLQSLVNEQVMNVALNPNSNFSSTSFNSVTPTGFVPGYALLTMFVNGTPSISRIISYSLAAQTISNFPPSETLNLHDSPFTPSAAASSGLPLTYTVVSGPATISSSGNIVTVTLTGTGTVVLMAAQAGNGIYAPVSAIQTITVGLPPAITSANTTSFPAGQADSFTVTATGPPAPTFSATGLPTWANLNSTTGVISGTPPDATGSPFTMTLTASNGIAPDAIQHLKLTVSQTFSQWQALYSLGGGATATPLNDGVSNLSKFFFNINPTQVMTASDRAALPMAGSIILSGTPYLTLTYRQNAAATGITVSVQTSPDLVNWTTVASPTIIQIGTDPNTGDPIMRAQVPLATPTPSKEFIRLTIASS